MQVRKFLEWISDLIWIFLIGSFVGFIYENLLMFFRGNYALRQGLLYEPLIPIYGIGLVVFYLIYKNLKLGKVSKPLKYLIIFLIALVMGGVTEYIGSWIQEVVFGTVSWDYSYMRFDLNGRTSLYHSSIWGVSGLAFYIILLPIINKLKCYKNNKIGIALTVLLSAVLLADCTISTLACNRREERRNDEVASTKLDQFLDRYYPDVFIDRIYNNANVVKK